MRAIREAGDASVEFVGVGGDAMEAEGLHSLFSLSEIAVMGILPVIARLPRLIARIRQTARAIVAARPDGLVIIDSPDFTHRVARLVRRSLPRLPVIDYVSPSVWAWRPGRARRMRSYVDRVLALLPFEPAVHKALGGPVCDYVGHPLIERLDELRPDALEAARRGASPPSIVVLPGSRRSEINRLCEDFGAGLALVGKEIGALEVILPTLPDIEHEIRRLVASWSVAPKIVVTEKEKFAAFRRARAALAASGTVTLELALAGVPMIGAYKVSLIEEQLKYLVKAPSFLLPNLILGERAIPEILQRECTPENLASALLAILRDSPERAAQIQSLRQLDGLMQLPGGEQPSERAARLILETIRTGAALPAPARTTA